MTLARNNRRHGLSGSGILDEQLWKAIIPLVSGLFAVLAVALVPAQFKALSAALLAAILIASLATILSPGSPRADVQPIPGSPRWILIVTSMGIGATTFLAIRLPGNLTIGDALLAVALLGVMAQPGVTVIAIHAIPRWFWWSTSLVPITAAAATLRPEVAEPGNISTAFRTWSAMTLVPLLIVVVGSTSRRLETIAKAFVLGSSLSALAAVAQAAGLWNPVATLGVQHFPGRATGLSVHPNHLGLASAMAAPIALALALQATRSLSRYTWTILWVVLVLGVTSSGSRAALGALVLGSALLAPLKILPRGNRAPKRGVDLGLPLGLVGIALALWLLPKATGVGDSLLAIAGRFGSPETLAASDGERALNYRQGVEDISKYWLIGRGFAESTHDHNIFLQAALSGGILFLAGLITYIWNPIIQAVRGVATTRDPILWGAFASFLAWPIIGLAQPNLRDRFLFVALGLILAALRAAPPRGAKDTTCQNTAPGRLVLASDAVGTPIGASLSQSPAQAGRSRTIRSRNSR